MKIVVNIVIIGLLALFVSRDIFHHASVNELRATIRDLERDRGDCAIALNAAREEAHDLLERTQEAVIQEIWDTAQISHQQGAMGKSFEETVKFLLLTKP